MQLDPKIKSTLDVRYTELIGDRAAFISRAEQYSKMSLPYILPASKTSGAQNKHGYQGIGAEAVNHLANKIVMTMYPISIPFYTLKFDAEIEEEMEKNKTDRVDTTAGLNKIVDLSLIEMQKLKLRPDLVTATKHLIITGNDLLVFTKKGTKVLGLDKWAIKRDPQGNMLRLITCEDVVYLTLPNPIKLAIRTKQANPAKKDEFEKLKLYTGYTLQEDGTFTIEQSVDDVIAIEPLTGIRPELVPAIPNTWNLTSGEDYGRGLMEDHSGDFHVLEFLSEARARGAATMMDVKYLVRAGAMTDVETLNKAPTGEYVIGNSDDIHVLQLDKFADGKLIQDVMTEYQARISRAFLMIQNSIRDSERTTAFEIQKVANELDGSLGGIYSTLSVDQQLPIAYQLLDIVDSELLKGSFQPIITAGVDALGRNRELEKIQQYSEMMAIPQSWAEPVQKRMDWDKYSTLVASQLSLDTSFLLPVGDVKDAEGQEGDNQTQQVLADSLASATGASMGKELIEGKK
tara:strand:+ start:28394 stop:29941 length:1548 start_codon:yes stop_codon:yes gene_type:complete